MHEQNTPKQQGIAATAGPRGVRVQDIAPGGMSLRNLLVTANQIGLKPGGGS